MITPSEQFFKSLVGKPEAEAVASLKASGRIFWIKFRDNLVSLPPAPKNILRVNLIIKVGIVTSVSFG